MGLDIHYAFCAVECVGPRNVSLLGMEKAGTADVFSMQAFYADG